MKVINTWNWKTFLLFPIWSFYNGFYVECLIFILPTIVWGILLISINTSVLSNLSIVLLTIVNALYSCLHVFILGIFSLFINENILKDGKVILNVIFVLHYVACNIYINKFRNNYLRQRNLSKKLCLKKKIYLTDNKWNIIELIIIISLAILIINSNALVVSMGLKIMP